MFRKRLSSLVLMFNVISLVYSIEIVRYKIYEIRDVNDAVAANLVLDGPFKVNDKTARMSCGIKCNLQSSCEVFSLNNTNYCTLYSDQTTVFDLKISTTSSIYAKYKIKACLDPETYADYNLMTCIPKHAYNQPCNYTEQCSSLMGLECADHKCLCANSNEK